LDTVLWLKPPTVRFYMTIALDPRIVFHRSA